MSASDYCEMCDLPLATCVHGMPPPPPQPVTKPAPRATRPTVKKAAATTAKSSPSSVPTRKVARRWTAPDDLKPAIVAVLTEAGGELDQDDLFASLETRLEDSFLAGDHERTPEGELRWQYAARRARQALVTEGVMERGRPGVWTLA